MALKGAMDVLKYSVFKYEHHYSVAFSSWLKPKRPKFCKHAEAEEENKSKQNTN